MKLSPLATELLEKRYVAKDETGKALETAQDVFKRVAEVISRVEPMDERFWCRKFLALMETGRFLPNSPTLMNAGRPLGQLSACFVLPIEDSMEGIFDAVKNTAVIHKSGGGTGFSFSRLRSKNAVVASTGGTASGPVSFMRVFDAATDTVKQGGKRRGANMGVLRVDHPDIMEFISCKSSGDKFSNFNISVGLTDKFMAALEDKNDEVVGQPSKYALRDPHTGCVTEYLVASEVFEQIVHNAWKNGDPGILFIDRVNNTQPNVGQPIEATNPCVTGDTLILAAPADWDGSNRAGGDWISISPLVGKEICVWNGVCWSKVRPFSIDTLQKVYTVEFKSGYCITCTADHMWWMLDSDSNEIHINTLALEPGMRTIAWSAPGNQWDMSFDIVKSIKPLGKKQYVYCLTEPREHAFLANHVLTGNCGEQPLLPYESCNLGSINLAAFCKDRQVDYSTLAETVYTAVRFLDDVIDANRYPLDVIRDTTLKYRKIGLGVMGWADMLIKLGVVYGSPESLDLASKIMRFINKTALDASIKLAAERGAFPAYEAVADEIRKFYTDKPVRNMTRTTIAPTGTISMIAGVSSGIEPIFSYAYIRKIVGMDDQLIIAAPLAEILTKYPKDTHTAIIDHICQTGNALTCPHLLEEDRMLLVSARDVTPENHVKMQAAFQQEVDNAISKTINLPHDATESDVKNIYMQAWHSGCKGITIYRDGSRDSQVLNIGTTKDSNKPAQSTVAESAKLLPRKRAKSLWGVTTCMRTGCGKLYVTINADDQGICEIFTSTGKGGGCASQSEAAARLASIGLRAGIPVEEIVSQLRGIRCPSAIKRKDSECTSCPDAIAKLLMDFHKKLHTRSLHALVEGHVSDNHVEPVYTSSVSHNEICPECGSELSHQGGCVTCLNCTWSKCN